MPPGESSTPQPIWKTILRFHIGDAQAIREILFSRGSLLIGAILVVTAGIARRYDQDSLISDPRWLYLPFVAAGISSIFVFGAVWAFGIARYRKEAGIGRDSLKFWRSFLAFFGAFLMTAPLAWLYAIPVESHLDLLTAAKWNTAVLALVSLWRLILITRVLQVGWGIPFFHTLLAVLLPASIEAWLGATVERINLVGVMGGIVLPPHIQFLSQVSGAVASGGFVVFLVTVVGLIIVSSLASRTLGFSPAAFESACKAFDPRQQGSFSKSDLVFSLFCLAVWIALAVGPQIRVWRFDRFERLADSSQFAESMTYLRDRNRSDFPSDYLMTKRGWFTQEQIIGLIGESQPGDPLWVREALFTLARPHVERIFNPWRNTPAEGTIAFFQEVASIPGGPDWFATFVKEEPTLIGEFFGEKKYALNEEFVAYREEILAWLISIGIDQSALGSPGGNDSTLSDQ